jgi:Transposase, Mutator family
MYQEAKLLPYIDNEIGSFNSQPHRVRVSSTNPLERLDLEIRRRTRVVGIFPNFAALRLIGMLLNRNQPSKESGQHDRHRIIAMFSNGTRFPIGRTLNQDGSKGEPYVNHVSGQPGLFLVIPIRQWNDR